MWYKKMRVLSQSATLKWKAKIIIKTTTKILKKKIILKKHERKI